MVAVSAHPTPASRSAKVPHGPVHVMGELATMAAAAALHGTVLATARIVRLFGIKIP